MKVSNFVLVAVFAVSTPEIVVAQSESPAGPPFGASYADIVDLADSAPLVVRAQPRRVVRVEDARAPGLSAGTGRFYIEAKTVALVSGQGDLAPALAFLADLSLDPKGKPPALKKKDVVVFARAVSGQPGELALVSRDSLLLWTPELDARLRAALTALIAPDAPARVTGVREIIHVPGSLEGEGDTQVFLTTANGTAASLLVQHRPGQPPRWGASFSELTADIANPPQRDSLAWYRLACFLPRQLPAGVNRSDTPEAAAQAGSDYRFVIEGLGDCPRQRR